VSTLTREIKYIVLKHDAQLKVWMQKFINELKFNDTTVSITLLKNNKLNIKLMHNTKQHSCIKYINVQHYYIQNIINNKEFYWKKKNTHTILCCLVKSL